jgi:hypothetical protein
MYSQHVLTAVIAASGTSTTTSSSSSRLLCDNSQATVHTTAKQLQQSILLYAQHQHLHTLPILLLLHALLHGHYKQYHRYNNMIMYTATTSWAF